MSKRTVTFSELKERRRCPYRAHLAYDELLAPIVAKPGLREGTIADEGMNALYIHVRDQGEYSTEIMLDAMRKAQEAERLRIEGSGLPMMDEEWTEIEERYELLEQVATHYVEFARANDDFDEIITMQLEGRVPVVSPSGRASTRYDFAFKPDGLVAANGRLWVLENKWWKQIAENQLRMLQMDEQCGMYLWAIRQAIRRGEAPRRVLKAVETYGEPVGVYYNVCRKKLPAVPALLKNGQTSQDKRMDTTAEVYRKTLIERGQDLADYAEILQLLENKGDTFHHREAVYRNEEELAEIGLRIYEGTRLIAEGHTFKNPTRDCVWDCQFFELCLEYSEELLDARYVRKERKHAEYEELEEAA